MTPATASIASYRTKKGVRFAVRYRDAEKRQKHETVPGYGRQAKEIATERAREIELGRHYVAPPQTLGAFLAEWLERRFNQVKESTWKRETESLRSLGVLDERDVGEGGAAQARRRRGTGCGQVAETAEADTSRGSWPGQTDSSSRSLSSNTLDRLQVADVEDVLAALARRAPRQAQIAGATLRTALKDAERRGQRIDKGLLEIKTNRYRSRDPRFLTWPQIQELQSWMVEHTSRLVPIGALTGARIGELLDLREWDLDLSAGLMKIRTGKTEASTRLVELPTTAVQLFKEQLLARAHTEGGYVFPAPMGGRWQKDNFLTRVWRPAVKRSGLGDVRPHDLRHTFASLMGAAGADIATIAAQLGHKDGGALLLRRYRHVFPAEARGAADKLDALVRGVKEKQEREEEAR